MNNILAVINTYNTNTTTFTGKLSNFYSANSGLGNAVTSQVNGLTVSSNCTIIADSIRFFYNMYCINLLNRTVKIGKNLILFRNLLHYTFIFYVRWSYYGQYIWYKVQQFVEDKNGLGQLERK